MSKEKLVRITTVPLSLEKLLENQLAFMQQHYDVIAVSADEERLKKVGEKEGVRTFSVELTRQITPFKDLVALWKLYRFLRKERPLIVHSHTPKAGIIGMLAAKLARIPNRLHTVAGLPLLEATGLKRWLLDIIEKITYRCATKVYPNSEGLREIILNKKLCKLQKLKVIGNGSSNGINTAYFNTVEFQSSELRTLKERLGITIGDFVFIFVGRLVGDKGINELIAAFSRLRKESELVKLVLVGPLENELDPLEQDTLSTIAENEAILSLGYQNDVRPYFAISDALVFPSYREGFPNVVMQAGSMSLPSIVSDINGCNEIIINNKNGLIVPVKNADYLYLALKQILLDQALYQGLASNARKMIVDRYEQQIIWNLLLLEYRTIQQKDV